MTQRARVLLLVVGAIAALMVLPGVSAMPVLGAPASPSASSHGAASTLPSYSSVPGAISPAPVNLGERSSTGPVSAGASSLQGRILSELQSNHVPSRDAFLPNFGAKIAQKGDLVTPLYNVTPAPMGVGFFGIQDINGVNVGTVTYTRSVEASVTLNSVDPLYVTSSAPDEFTMQLNTVGTNIDLFGNESYQFWLQNVPIYAAGSQTLSFEDNIWNFSSPAITFTANSIYAHGPGGVVAAPVLYYAIGPSFHVPTPFTVVVYNNLTVANNRSTIFFNYTVEPSTGPAFSGSYDFVEFNSTPQIYGPAPPPVNQINGQKVGDTNFLLNDAEIMLGGPGGGSTTTLFQISGSMGLWILPNGTLTYQTVPSAYDFGTDTGETSEGIAEWATLGTTPMAELGTGPSDLYGLWGLVGAQQGEQTVTINLSPTNAFVFANPGAIANDSTAAWAPTPVSGPAVYNLAPGTYTFQYLLAEHTPAAATYTSGGTWTVSLPLNPGLGDYTPLWAESNSQLAAISSGGHGTISNPYVLFNGPANVDPLFGELNDYVFPVFPAIYLIDTSAYVTAANLPAFDVAYLPIQVEAARLVQNGLPLTDQLNIELYHASHVSIIDSSQLSGWFASFLSFGEPASIYLWNSSHDLIAGNTFYVESNGITLSGGAHNVIWGNVFYPEAVVAANPSSVLNYGAWPSIWEFESHDLIYNNAVLTPVTAISPPENFYTGAFQINLDRWNVVMQSATHVKKVNGFRLSGSILGLSYEGGNYWSNYGTPQDPYGVIPYTDGGLIYSGGDYVPLVPFVLYEIIFVETGLPAGTFWSVTINGYTQSTNTTTMVFYDPNGVYAFVVGPVTGYHVHPSKGAVILNNANYTVHLKFRK